MDMTHENTVPSGTAASETSQVQIKFITRTRKYIIPDVSILVPIRLKRAGLSEIINHLLGKGELCKHGLYL
jgi:hypothetical protein